MSDRDNFQAFLTTARKRFQLVVDAETEFRILALEALRFYNGDQWPEDIRAQRKLDKRPCLTFNRLKQFVHQVTNDNRQNKPSPQVAPVDDHADVETAEFIQGVIRQICRQSKADAVRSYAGLYQVITGRGWYRILTELAPDGSGDQEIYIRRIKNQASVYMDPSAQEPDYSDAKWCFIVEDILIDDYKAEYPDSEAAGLQDFASLGDNMPGWATAETLRVAEYFHFEHGVLHWCKMNAVEKLEQTTLPGPWIPVIPVLGEELEIDGKTSLAGMVHDAMDAQKQYNFMRTMQTETVALAPRAPYVAAEGQIEGHEREWQQANTRNLGVLTYKAVDVNGHLVPPPQRNAIEAPIQAITVAVREAAEDLKNSTGIHDASLGARSNETSGVAIRQRQMEGDNANFHYADAMATAVNHETRILIAWIPKVYDRPGRIVRMLGEDGSRAAGMIGGEEAPEIIPAGVKGIYDLRVGRYDVATDIAPSYQTKRQEASDKMIELAKVDPGLMQTAPDLVYKTLDIPGSQEIAERRKKALPPGLVDDDENAQPIPPRVQAQLQQYGQIVEELTQQVETMSEEIRLKKYELDSKERTELAKLDLQREKIQADLAIELAKLGSTEALEQLRQELAVLRDQYQMLQQSAEAERAREADAATAAASTGDEPV